MKRPRPPPKNEVILGYATHPVLGKVVPGRKPAKKFPYNTRLDNGKGTMQACCKCFSRASQGSCAAHTAEQYVRLMAAEAALREADKRIAVVVEAYRREQEVIEGKLDPLKFDKDEIDNAIKEVLALRRVPDDQLRPKAAVL